MVTIALVHKSRSRISCLAINLFQVLAPISLKKEHLAPRGLGAKSLLSGSGLKPDPVRSLNLLVQTQHRPSPAKTLFKSHGALEKSPDVTEQILEL